MRTILLAVCTTALAVSVQAQSPRFQWARQAGGPSNDRATAVVIDSDNNPCVTGGVAYETDFGDTTVTAGFLDSFVARYASDGNLDWVRLGGGPGLDRGEAITADGRGNIYVTGFFSGRAGFGSDTLEAAGRDDIFVAKYGPNGDALWVRRAGGTGDDTGLGIAADAAGERIAVTGSFERSADFSGTTLSTSVESDIFLAMYDGGGALVWARQAGAADDYDDRGLDVALTSSGDVIVIGVFEETATFGTTQLVGTDSEEAFVARYTANGDVDWVKHITGDSDEEANGVAVDSGDRIFIAGSFGQTLVIGDSTRTNPEANEDVFVAALSAGGDLLWLRHAGGRLYDRTSAITADVDGHVIITGYFQGDLEFDDVVFTHQGGTDMFVAAYGTDGNYEWAKQAGGTGSPRSYGVTVNAQGEVYVVGDFIGTTEFDDFTVSDVSLEDVFVAKLESVIGIGMDEPKAVAPETRISVHPNPFRSKVTIVLNLPQPQNVRVTVYDVLGRELLAVDEGFRVAGEHYIQLDGVGAAAGIYFCSVHTEFGTQTVPMVRSP